MAQTQLQLLERQTLAQEAIATALTYFVAQHISENSGNQEDKDAATDRAAEHIAAWVGRKPAETPPT